MRTTLDIDNDVLHAAKERARRDKKSTGEVISELARYALTNAPQAFSVRQAQALYGFQPFPKRGVVVTNALIDKLRVEDAV